MVMSPCIPPPSMLNTVMSSPNLGGGSLGRGVGSGDPWSSNEAVGPSSSSGMRSGVSSSSLLLVLGNAVISKIFLHTRKIMVMHSNERGECCLHTLVDRSRKRSDNTVDVVVRLHDPTDQVPNARHLRVQHTFSPMTSLEL